MDTVQERIRSLIDKHHAGGNGRANLSHAAELTGVAQPTLSRIYNGKVSDPRGDVLLRIASAYKTTVEWLLTGVGEAPRDDVSPIAAETVALSDVARSQYLRWALALSRLPLDPKIRAILEGLPFVAPQLHVQFDERGKSEREVAKTTRRIEQIGNEFLAMTVVTAASNWTALVENLSEVLGPELLADTLTAQIDSLILRDTAFIEWLVELGALPSDLPARYDEYFAEKMTADTGSRSTNGRKGG